VQLRTWLLCVPGRVFSEQQHSKPKENATTLISMVGLKSANPVDIPHEVNVKYHRDDGDLLPDVSTTCG